jgi:hypothetical protein
MKNSAAGALNFLFKFEYGLIVINFLFKVKSNISTILINTK